MVLIALVSALRSARPVRERQTVDIESIDRTLPAVRFPDAFAQQGVELKAFWTGGPEGFLASIAEPLDLGKTVALLGDMRSRLQPQPAAKSGVGRFDRHDGSGAEMS